jgi:hypothetical protein
MPTEIVESRQIYRGFIALRLATLRLADGVRKGFVSATLPDGTIVRDEQVLRAVIVASEVALRRPQAIQKPFANHSRKRRERLGVEACFQSIPV